MPDAYVIVRSMAHITVEPGWLHKEAAAKMIGVSIRQIENLAALGRIRKHRLERQVNERSARVLYSLEDLDALKAGTPNSHGAPAPPAPKTEVTALAPAGAAFDFGALAAHLAALARAFPPPADPRPWLTLAEAVEYSGLPEVWLVAQARAGAAFAVNVGQGSKAHWRFNRAALAEARR
jgi:hypothetical protein